MKNEKIAHLQAFLLHWFAGEGRSFPWRNPGASNYEIILAEILLQRTKAGTVAKYLPFFLEKYPSWERLSEATEVELKHSLFPFGLNNLKAKRLWMLAQEVRNLNGRLPDEKDIVRELSLFGNYTLNAFELFVLRKPAPLLDVNMARFLERYFEPKILKDYRYDKRLNQLAVAVTNHQKSKEINWAILDFASLVCTKRNPRCCTCPLFKTCTFYQSISKK
jgi:A/G-specific adenine glycosylase